MSVKVDHKWNEKIEGWGREVLQQTPKVKWRVWGWMLINHSLVRNRVLSTKDLFFDFAFTWSTLTYWYLIMQSVKTDSPDTIQKILKIPDLIN